MLSLLFNHYLFSVIDIDAMLRGLASLYATHVLGEFIVGEYLRRRECGKNIETTKHLGGFSILLYVCCSLHQFSVTMVNHCLYWVEDLVS